MLRLGLLFRHIIVCFVELLLSMYFYIVTWQDNSGGVFCLFMRNLRFPAFPYRGSGLVAGLDFRGLVRLR